MPRIPEATATCNSFPSPPAGPPKPASGEALIFEPRKLCGKLLILTRNIFQKLGTLGVSKRAEAPAAEPKRPAEIIPFPLSESLLEGLSLRARIALGVLSCYQSRQFASEAAQLKLLQKHRRKNEPTWSVSSLRRTKAELRKAGLLVARSINKRRDKRREGHGRYFAFRFPQGALPTGDTAKAESKKPTPAEALRVNGRVLRAKSHGLRAKDHKPSNYSLKTLPGHFEEERGDPGRGVAIGYTEKPAPKAESPASPSMQATKLVDEFNRYAEEAGIPRRERVHRALVEAVRRSDATPQEQLDAVAGLFAERDSWALSKGHGIIHALKRWSYFASLGAEMRHGGNWYTDTARDQIMAEAMVGARPEFAPAVFAL